MANQVRELIEQSVNAYVKFIQRYKFPTYPKPDEIIKREYDADSPFEDNFISLKLRIPNADDSSKAGGGPKIMFDTPIEQVQQELEQIVDQIVKQSCNLPRPENTIARSDKMHLWDVQIDDEIVIKAKDKISETLRENLEVVSLAANVYDEFLFILKERERIEAFINKEPITREEFQKEIDMYQECINKITETMPFEIRMNMFLIKCSDINNALCDECEGLMKLILDKVESHVFQKMAP